MKEQMEVFKSHLQDFASKYAKDIRKDPAFRQRFQAMCANIGVDPLACE
jgi:ESCRT-II complex subunit VPS22